MAYTDIYYSWSVVTNDKGEVYVIARTIEEALSKLSDTTRINYIGRRGPVIL